MTFAQEASLNALAKLGFNVNRNDGKTIYMSKRIKYSTYYAEFDADGYVNGLPLKDFIADFKARKLLRK
jgi:hypothetical protein